MAVTRLDDESWMEFVCEGRTAVILSRSDCSNCHTLLAEIEELDIAVGYVVLDKVGCGEFKSAHPDISLLATILPFCMLFDAGEWKDSLLSGRVSDLIAWFE